MTNFVISMMLVAASRISYTLSSYGLIENASKNGKDGPSRAAWRGLNQPGQQCPTVMAIRRCSRHLSTTSRLPKCIPRPRALRIEGKASGFGAGDLVTAGEVDGVEEALPPGLIGSVGGFQQGHSPSCRPPRRERFGLLQDGLHGGVLQVRRVAVLA